MQSDGVLQSINAKIAPLRLLVPISVQQYTIPSSQAGEWREFGVMPKLPMAWAEIRACFETIKAEVVRHPIFPCKVCNVAWWFRCQRWCL